MICISLMVSAEEVVKKCFSSQSRIRKLPAHVKLHRLASLHFSCDLSQYYFLPPHQKFILLIRHLI